MAQVCGPTELTLCISNVPRGYDILRIGALLQSNFGHENSITAICLKKSVSTQQTDSVEVTLSNQKDANLLLHRAKLSIVFNSQEHLLVITKAQPKKSQTFDDYREKIGKTVSNEENQPDYDIHDTKRWNQLLHTDPDLFTKYKQSCVLVRNISTDYGFDEVRNVIEEAVEGAKVKKILRIPDGHLIALEKKSTAENLISLDELMLGENELEFEKKVVPEVDEQVLGIKTRLGADFVSSILESCYELQSRFKVLEMSSKRLLVVFENRKSDFLKLIDELDNLKRNAKLEAMRLCYSDRVVVKNVDKNEEDRIKLKVYKKGYAITHYAFNEKDQDLHLFLSDFKGKYR